MGQAILNALFSVVSKNPTLLENLIELGVQWLAGEMQKAVAAQKAAPPA
jgi:hypothetical protein